MNLIYTATHRRHAPLYEFAKDSMRPYSETPARADVILQALQNRGFADIVTPREYPLDPIRAVHDADYLDYLKNVYTTWIAEGQPEMGVIPYAFAVRTMLKKPDQLVR